MGRIGCIDGLPERSALTNFDFSRSTLKFSWPNCFFRFPLTFTSWLIRTWLGRSILGKSSGPPSLIHVTLQFMCGPNQYQTFYIYCDNQSTICRAQTHLYKGTLWHCDSTSERIHEKQPQLYMSIIYIFRVLSSNKFRIFSERYSKNKFVIIMLLFRNLVSCFISIQTSIFIGFGVLHLEFCRKHVFVVDPKFYREKDKEDYIVLMEIEINQFSF